MSFIFGGNTGASYEDIQRRRAVAQQLMAQRTAPRNVGEGLHAIGQALLGRAMERKASRQEDKLRADFDQQFGKVAPQGQAMLDLYNNPMASDGHKKVLGALMAKGVPGFSRGGKIKRGGLAIVGEAGPELVELPAGAEIDPTNLMPAPNVPAPAGRFDDGNAYQVADSGMLTNDAIPAQTAIADAAQTPAFGGDAVQSRRLADDEIAYRDAMNGLSGIMEQIADSPELLDTTHTLRGRASTGLLRLRDRSGIDAIDIGPEGEKQLADATAYRQELLTRVNQYIKDITGAQVGQGDETKRLMAVQANESDSPTQVVAKIENALKLARLDIVRRRMMQRTDGQVPSDKDVRDFLRQRGQELYDLSVQEGFSPTEARLRAAEMMTEEFGW